MGEIVSIAYSDLRDLRDEMQEWFDNMDANNLGHTQKAQDVETCAQQLDSADEELRDTLQNTIDEASGSEFPGMY